MANNYLQFSEIVPKLTVPERAWTRRILSCNRTGDDGDVVPPAIWQCSATTSTPQAAAEDRADGNGYGLSAMRQRVRRMGGDIDIESSADGTAISASVPTSPAR